jgi:hypothetical protein
MSKKFKKLPPEPQLGYFVVFSVSHWKQVELEYGQQLPDRVRKLISLATLLLTLGLPMEQNAPTIGGSNADILAEIERLVKQAEQLRAKLYPRHYWTAENQSPSERISPLHRRLGVQLEQIDDYDSDNPESAVLRISLTGFIESGLKVVRRARDSGHTVRQGDIWDAWIAWLTLIMRAFDRPYGTRSEVYRVKKTERPPPEGSPFVRLVKSLELIDCPDYRRFFTMGGLAKAIDRSRRRIKNIPNKPAMNDHVEPDDLERALLSCFQVKSYGVLNSPDPLAQPSALQLAKSEPDDLEYELLSCFQMKSHIVLNSPNPLADPSALQLAASMVLNEDTRPGV